MNKILLAFFPLVVLAADSPPKACYLESLVACAEAEERYVEDLYHAFLRVVEGKQLQKGEFRVPAHLAEAKDRSYAFERAYYITPNLMKGFCLVFPKECMKLEEGMLMPLSAMKLERQYSHQGILVLVMTRSN